MLVSVLKRLGNAGVDLLYPPRCPLCGMRVVVEAAPCDDCAATLRPLEGEALLPHVKNRAIERASACFAYEGPLQEAVHAYKFGGRIELARFFADALARRARELVPIDAIVPVPTPRGRRFRRGFNPAAFLAHRVARTLRVPCCDRLLERRGAVRPQTGLARTERLANVRGAFVVRASQRNAIADRRLLLVDDVLTTGATLNECARQLVRAGARSASALAIARAL